jgi:hypothetical protein
MRRGFVFLSFLALTMWARAGGPVPLDPALLAWLTAPDAWAFTQCVRQYERDGALKEERLERYDPSQPPGKRWTLLQVNGRAPTPAELSDFAERRGRSKKRRPLSPMDCIDLASVAVTKDSADEVSYHVPLRSDATRLVPLEKISIAITIDKESRRIEHISADLPTPLRVAFGLARVTDAVLDLRFDTGDTPAPAAPSGTARVTFFKLGNRNEVAWSDFKRVSS